MRTSLLKRASATVAAFLLASLVIAAEPAKAGADIESFVPAGYDVTIRIELAKMLAAPQLEALRSQVITPEREVWMDSVAELTGVDLRSDVDRFLIAGYFGGKRDADGLVFLQGRWDENRLIGFLQGTGSYEAQEHSGKTVHCFWSDQDNEMRYAVFPAPGVLAIGRLDPVVQCTEALADPAKRLDASEAYKTCRSRIRADAALAVAALPPAAQPRDEMGRTILANLRGIYVSAVLAEQLEVTAGFLTPSAEIARTGKDIVQGLMGLASLMDARPELQQFARRVATSASQDAVVASLQLKPDEALRVIQLVKRGGRM